MELNGHSEQLARRKRYHEAIKEVLLGNAPRTVRPAVSTNIPAGAVIHTVQPGEYLWAIGQKYGVDFNQIAKDNNISNPSVIQPGMKLTIRKSSPSSTTETSSATPAQGSSTASTAGTFMTGLRALGNLFQSSGESNVNDLVYTVQPGDYLWAIGQKYGVDYNQIARDNNIANPSVIHPGMKLTIKKAGGSSSQDHQNHSGNARSSTSNGGSNDVVYVVQPGDYLWAIGQKYGVDFNKIARDNNIANPSVIHPGMKLTIRK